MDLEKLKYPIGKFSLPEKFGEAELNLAIENIEKFPKRINDAVKNLNEDQLNTEYRPEGWTMKQVVHHCADSHMNSLIRFKLALTEFNPTIIPYNEAAWAELPDSRNLAIRSSLNIIDGIHLRWNVLLNTMTEEQYNRTFYHPANDASMTLKEATAMYAWHCNHHLGHILNLKIQEGW